MILAGIDSVAVRTVHGCPHHQVTVLLYRIHLESLTFLTMEKFGKQSIPLRRLFSIKKPFEILSNEEPSGNFTVRANVGLR